MRRVDTGWSTGRGTALVKKGTTRRKMNAWTALWDAWPVYLSRSVVGATRMVILG